MEWRNPQKMEGGARGSYQLSSEPGGYAVTYSIRENGSAVFSASHRDQIFANFYIDDLENKPLIKHAARAMRATCGLHHAGIVDFKAAKRGG